MTRSWMSLMLGNMLGSDTDFDLATANILEGDHDADVFEPHLPASVTSMGMDLANWPLVHAFNMRVRQRADRCLVRVHVIIKEW